MSYSKERGLSRKENGNYSILFTLGEMKLLKLAALQVGFDPCGGRNLVRYPIVLARIRELSPVKEKEKPLTAAEVKLAVTKEPSPGTPPTLRLQ
jgi:hypothetical protein